MFSLRALSSLRSYASDLLALPFDKLAPFRDVLFCQRNS